MYRNKVILDKLCARMLKIARGLFHNGKLLFRLLFTHVWCSFCCELANAIYKIIVFNNAAMKPKSQITAYIIWQTKIFLSPKIACYSNESKFFQAQKLLWYRQKIMISTSRPKVCVLSMYLHWDEKESSRNDWYRRIACEKVIWS